MTRANDAFAYSIQDAENLLKHFDALNELPPPPESEVLKRAGLIMAMTAWETYVEDRLVEAADQRLKSLADTSIASYMQSKLKEEMRRLHNPTSEKSLQLFRDFAGVDLTEKWAWNNFDAKVVRQRLDEYIGLRGDVVHRSRPLPGAQKSPDAVNREDLEKAIRFLKALVQATEKALSSVAS